MVYLIAAIMGYFIATNGMIERRAKEFIGLGYANSLLARLSALGGLGGWLCVLPAAYFVSSADDSGFLQGLLFCLAAFGGAVAAGITGIRGIGYLAGAFCLPANIGLAIIVFALTR